MARRTTAARVRAAWNQPGRQKLDQALRRLLGEFDLDQVLITAIVSARSDSDRMPGALLPWTTSEHKVAA
jgi:hypothetical protein